jgi:hypothetical protein
MLDCVRNKLVKEEVMATNFCQKCKQSHPGRVCDYDEQGECAETLDPSQELETNGSTTEPFSQRKVPEDAAGDLSLDPTATSRFNDLLKVSTEPGHLVSLGGFNSRGQHD